MSEDKKIQTAIRNTLAKLDAARKELNLLKSEPIAIVGMACRFPAGANNIAEFWKFLERGGDGISKIPENRPNLQNFYDPDPEAPGKMISPLSGFLDGDVSLFDAKFFGMSPREALMLDPQQRLLLEVSYEAILSAGFTLESVKGSSTGLFVGILHHDYSALMMSSGDKKFLNAYYGTGFMTSTASGRISYCFDFTGPNFSIDTACSSSLVAIHQACLSLRNRECNMALAGGVNLILSPDISIGFTKAKMLSPDGHCKSFDESANGYVRGEGCGILVLKRLSDAERDGDTILALIRGSGTNHGGSSDGFTVPNEVSQEKLIREVVSKSNLKFSDIDYLEAHGTGTPVGDPIEVEAIGKTYGQRKSENPLKIGSVKTNIGHTELSAGVASVIKVVLALQHEMLPKQLHFKKLNPKIDPSLPLKILTENEAWKRSEKPRRAAVNSFGFSGTNAHLILEEGPKLSEEQIYELEKRQNFKPDYHREKFWAEAANINRGKSLISVHPLLGEQISNPNNEVIFVGELNTALLSYLKDHSVLSDPIFPGAGYVEMMFAAAIKGLGWSQVTLKEVSFESVLSLPIDIPVNLRVILRNLDGVYLAEVYTEDANNEWVLHAKSTLVENYDPEEKLEIEEIKKRCTNEIDITKEYEELSILGLTLGPNFQTIKKMYLGDDESFSEIYLDFNTENYLTMPAILDGAFQSIILTAGNKTLILPIFCEKLELFQALGNQIYVHVFNINETHESFHGSANILDASGKILAKIKNLRGQKTTNNAVKKIIAHHINESKFLYEWQWNEKPLLNVSVTNEYRKWLIFGNGELSERIKSYLEKTGRISTIIPKEKYPKSKTEYKAMLGEGCFDCVVHLGALDESKDLSATSIRNAQKYGVKSVLELTQALIEMHQKPDCILIGKNVTTNNIAQATLLGLYKSLLVEHKEIKIKFFDILDDCNIETLFSLIINHEAEHFYRIKYGKIYVPRIAHLKWIEHDKLIEEKINHNSTYLITGGMGGLGLALAKWLASHGAGNIVLTGRQPLNEDIQSGLKSLENSKAVFTYEAFDVSDERSVEILLNRLQSGEKPLKGIFHLAGVLDDATYLNQDWTHFEKVYAAKVYGSFYLHQYSKNLDLFVTFSSIASSLGNAGQANYAAANSFMDALCEYRHLNGEPGLSLAWGPWGEIGMAKDLVARHAKSGLLALKTAEGFRALEAALLSKKANVTVANINWENFLKQWIERPNWFEAFGLKKEVNKDDGFQIGRLTESERLKNVTDLVKEKLAAVLGLTPSQVLDEKQDFSDMGLDSLMRVELKNALQEALGKYATVSATAVFDYSNVQKLSSHLNDILIHSEAETKSTPVSKNDWLIEGKCLSTPTLRVICFHHAGGSANNYISWQNLVDENIEMDFIELPGRGWRSDEPLPKDTDLVIDAIISAIQERFDLPTVFFAHSFGVFLASEVARKLRVLKKPLPIHLIFSGFPSPYGNSEYENKMKIFSSANDSELVHFVSEFFGEIPEATLKNPKSLKLLLDIIRADGSLLRSPILDQKFKIPITAIWAKEDQFASKKDLELWSNVTETDFNLITVPGKHLTLLEDPSPYIKAIVDIAKKYI